MSNRTETTPLAGILAALAGLGEATENPSVPADAGRESSESKTEALSKSFDDLTALLEAPEKASRVADAMSKLVPHAIILQFFFDPVRVVDGEEVNLIERECDRLGSSDAVLGSVMELESFPDSGPFSQPRFDFDLEEFQAKLPKLVSLFDAFLYNIAGKTYMASVALDRTEAKAAESEDNTFSPAGFE